MIRRFFFSATLFLWCFSGTICFAESQADPEMDVIGVYSSMVSDILLMPEGRACIVSKTLSKEAQFYDYQVTDTANGFIVRIGDTQSSPGKIIYFEYTDMPPAQLGNVECYEIYELYAGTEADGAEGIDYIKVDDLLFNAAGGAFEKKDFSEAENIAVMTDGDLDKTLTPDDILLQCHDNEDMSEEYWHYGYKNGNGELKIGYYYSKAGIFFNGRAVVSPDKKEGLIDGNGNYVIKPIYDDILPLNNGLYRVEDDGLYGICNAYGDLLVEPCEYVFVRDGYIFAGTDIYSGSDSWYKAYDLDGNPLTGEGSLLPDVQGVCPDSYTEFYRACYSGEAVKNKYGYAAAAGAQQAEKEVGRGETEIEDEMDTETETETEQDDFARLADMAPFSESTGYLEDSNNVTDNFGNVYDYAIECGGIYNGDRWYDLSGKYNVMNGTVCVKKGNEGVYGTIQIYGDDVLLWENTQIDGLTRPISLNLDVTGVMDLKIHMKGGYFMFSSVSVMLADVTFQKIF